MDNYLLSCSRYIERNPLAAGIVAAPWDWRWSSCRAHALGEPDELLTESLQYLELGANAARRQERWREFLLGDDPKEPVIAEQDWLLGEAAFRKEATAHRSRAVGRRKGRPRKVEGSSTF